MNSFVPSNGSTTQQYWYFCTLVINQHNTRNVLSGLSNTAGSNRTGPRITHTECNKADVVNYRAIRMESDTLRMLYGTNLFSSEMIGM